MPNVSEAINGWHLRMVACYPPGCGSTIASDAAPSIGPIITDARPAPIPVLDGPSSWMTVTQPNRAELDEASYISSLYEGVVFGEGERRKQDYLRSKEAARMIGGRRG
jgi:hypothetical protein